MQETRHAFREALKELEDQALGGLDLVISQLDRALEAISYQDVELAGMVVADDDRIDGRYLEVHQGILSLLARQAPVAGDLRIVAALLHVIRCVERMGDQCVNIAKLVPLSGHEPPKDKDILDAIERMGQLRALAGLAGQGGVRRAQRRPGPGPGPPGRRDQPAQPRDLPPRGRDRRRPRVREWAMFMILVARAWSGSATTPSTSPSRPCSWSPACSASSPTPRAPPPRRRARRLSTGAPRTVLARPWRP